MPSIKKYTSVHTENDHISFDIKRMEDIFAQHQGQPDEPHRHDYYTLILVKKAKGKHLIDFHEFELREQQIYFISPGQVHQIIEEQPSVGCVMTFSPQFMLENGIHKTFIEALHLFQDFGFAPPLEINEEELAAFTALTDQMFDYTHSRQKLKYHAVGALLKLFLIKCNNLCSLAGEENTQQVQASVTLLKNFKDLIEREFRHWHKVSQYAEALNVTSDYLNASVKSLTGKSAKEHIQSRITVEAKRLLIFSGLTTKEIAFELGFSEPGNFSQFFKKCVGEAPSGFRGNA
ncbi:MAG: helix-turn-helix domain-containing protein [Bacteroidetes bacterium]|nr:helix-turn-helix domain-containing protein [Bacteroidota bacterium]MCB0846792.1 helix-turn-helix domain-containing protein [Bacteroidota bacterium]